VEDTDFSQHFIGNRAIHMGNGETPLQIAFSPGFTVLSFFVPIIVLWGAFLAIGTNDAVSWWRIGAGGLLCGTAVCGMHYLGNASIQNYTCVYKVGNVIGSAIIAVAASTVALSTFFVFRAMWANAWWKRLFSGGVMAGAVSGMHWCAAVGTQYRLVTLRNGIGQPSRNATVIVVICLVSRGETQLS
jgi:NO-binding membrane sensor protein with MHYT domain